MRFIPFSYFLFLSVLSFAQNEMSEIFLTNPSFESLPRLSQTPHAWSDCGSPGESEVDIHPVPSNVFSVTKDAAEGDTYVGMVVRENDTHEAIGQRLKRKMEGGAYYVFDMYLAQSPTYISKKRLGNTIGQNVNYATPCRLRIWGGSRYCQEKELLASSTLIDHEAWKDYRFYFTPEDDWSYITFEVFYKDEKSFRYNGNILIDNASSILEISEEEFEQAHQLSRSNIYGPKKEGQANNNQKVTTAKGSKVSTASMMPLSTGLDQADEKYFKENMPLLRFRRGMLSMTEKEEKILSEIAKRLLHSQNTILCLHVRVDNHFIRTGRVNYLREFLVAEGLPAKRFTFIEQEGKRALLQSGNSSLDVKIY